MFKINSTVTLSCAITSTLLLASSALADPASELLRIEPGTAVSGDAFGQSLAIGEEFLVIGTPGDDDLGGDTGTVTVVWPDPSTGLPMFTSVVNAGAINSGAYFGRVVAAHGNTFAVAAPHAENGALSPVGKVFVYTTSMGIVTHQASFQPAGLSPSDLFGWDIDLVGDTLVVTAPGSDGGAGSVWVFDRTGGDWNAGTELPCPHAEDGNAFGWSVAINYDDESQMVIGAPWDYDSGTDSGRVFYFEKASTMWLNTAEIDQTDLGVMTFHLGWEVDYDGDHFAIGEPDNQRIHVMGWTGAFPLWGLVDTLSPTSTSSTNYFGESFALNGELLAAGVRLSDLNGALSGAAYLFRLTGPGQWDQLVELEDSIGDTGWHMGKGIAMVGGILAIGSTGAESNAVLNAGTVLGFNVDSTPGCPADTVMTGAVDLDDMMAVMAAWGPCGMMGCSEDLNEDGLVDVQDLLELLAAWGSCG